MISGLLQQIGSLFLSTDILRAVLCGCESIQEIANLHRESGRAVQRKETP